MKELLVGSEKGKIKVVVVLVRRECVGMGGVVGVLIYPGRLF